MTTLECRPRRSRGTITKLFFGYLLFGAAALPPPTTAPGLDEPLGSMTVALRPTAPPAFVLTYHGPRTPFRGLVCYHFAGYNETCLDPDLGWLTPATQIVLAAPGGVPLELLRGYDVFVRFPGLSDTTFRYPLAAE